MSAKRRERRARPAGLAPAPQPPQPMEARVGPPPLPVWHWRTFPVYFAFALGAFLGVYAGYLAGFIQGKSDAIAPAYVVFIASALLLGFGLSRFTSRFMVTRRWVKPRPKKRA